MQIRRVIKKGRKVEKLKEKKGKKRMKKVTGLIV
jgi:hypothetical protein